MSPVIFITLGLIVATLTLISLNNAQNKLKIETQNCQCHQTKSHRNIAQSNASFPNKFCHLIDSSDCKSYKICGVAGEILYQGACHFGTLFDEDTESCQYPYKIKNITKCLKNQSYHICDISPPGYYANENDCSKYHHCQGIRVSNGSCTVTDTNGTTSSFTELFLEIKFLGFSTHNNGHFSLCYDRQAMMPDH